MVGGVEDELLLEVEESPGLSVSPHAGLASPAHCWTLVDTAGHWMVDTGCWTLVDTGHWTGGHCDPSDEASKVLPCRWTAGLCTARGNPVCTH